MPAKSKLLTKNLITKCKKNIKEQGKQGEIARRLQAIISADKHSISEVAKIYNITRATLMNWIKLFEKESEQGFLIKSGRGRKRIFDKSTEKKIKKIIEKNCNITIDQLKVEIEKKFKITTGRSTVYRLMKRLGFSHITPRPSHYKSNKQQQEAFKKN